MYVMVKKRFSSTCNTKLVALEVSFKPHFSCFPGNIRKVNLSFAFPWAPWPKNGLCSPEWHFDLTF